MMKAFFVASTPTAMKAAARHGEAGAGAGAGAGVASSARESPGPSGLCPNPQGTGVGAPAESRWAQRGVAGTSAVEALAGGLSDSVASGPARRGIASSSGLHANEAKA